MVLPCCAVGPVVGTPHGWAELVACAVYAFASARKVSSACALSAQDAASAAQRVMIRRCFMVSPVGYVGLVHSVCPAPDGGVDNVPAEPSSASSGGVAAVESAAP